MSTLSLEPETKARSEFKVYGDPSIWGDVEATTMKNFKLDHTPKISVQKLDYAEKFPTKLQCLFKDDVFEIHQEIFPVRYRDSFYQNLARWNFCTVVAIDSSEVH